MSLANQLSFLNSLIKTYKFHSPAVYRFLLKTGSEKYLWSDSNAYLEFVYSLINCYFDDESVANDAKLDILQIVRDIRKSHLFYFGSQKLINLATEKLIQATASGIALQVAEGLFSWINESLIYMEPAQIEMCIDVLIQVCCGVGVNQPDSDKFIQFWDKYVAKNRAVKNIPHPATISINFYRRQYNDDLKIMAIECLIQLFVTLDQNVFPRQASMIYNWLCYIISWNSIISPSIRSIGLEFLCRFGGTSHHKATYQVGGNTLTSPCLSYIASPSNSSIRLELENYIFSLIAVTEFEPSYPIFISAIESLKQTLELQQICLMNVEKSSFAVKILSKHITNLISIESTFSNLCVDVPSILKKYDIFLSFYQMINSLLLYRPLLTKSQQDLMISTLLFGVGRWPPIAKHCLYGLLIALYELPNSMIRHLSAIILKISQVTSSNLALPNLEFLACLASLPNLHVNFSSEDYKRIFGIALTYLRQKNSGNTQQSTLAYYVTQVWFLSLKLGERSKFVPMIVSILLANSEKRNISDVESLDENVELVRHFIFIHSVGFGYDGTTHICRLLSKAFA